MNIAILALLGLAVYLLNQKMPAKKKGADKLVPSGVGYLESLTGDQTGFGYQRAVNSITWNDGQSTATTPLPDVFKTGTAVEESQDQKLQKAKDAAYERGLSWDQINWYTSWFLSSDDKRSEQLLKLDWYQYKNALGQQDFAYTEMAKYGDELEKIFQRSGGTDVKPLIPSI